MICTLFLIGVLGLILYFYYKRYTRVYDHFNKVGLKYIKPFPIFGLAGNVIFQKVNMYDLVKTHYDQYPNEKVYGAFSFNHPVYIIRDLNLVKQIAVTDFIHFQDHMPFGDTKTDDFFGKMLFVMKGKEWRDMRSSLSPLFTGSKMRLMLELVIGCSSQFTSYIESDINDKRAQTYDIKDIFSRFTNDVIASCAFGLEVDSLRNPKNEIFLVGQDFLSFQKFHQIFKMIFLHIAPKFAKLLGIKAFSGKMKTIFYDMMIHTMRVRKEQNIYRPDMINLLMILKDGNLSVIYGKKNEKVETERSIVNGEIKKTWTDNELIAQSFQFYIAGFETASAVMQFVAYELAIRPDIQDKLREEVQEINKNLNGKPLTYDAMKELKYMNNVINETLRFWSVMPMLDRICVKDYEYEDEDGFKLTIKEGHAVLIPANGFHMDSKYFPDPEKFDPERYQDGRANMDAWMSFGVGPRNCIGLRFARMEMKALFYYLLLNFKMNISKETQVPLKLKNSMFGPRPKEPIKIEFERL